MKNRAPSCGGYQTDWRGGNAGDSYGEGALFEPSMTGFRDFPGVYPGKKCQDRTFKQAVFLLTIEPLDGL